MATASGVLGPKQTKGYFVALAAIPKEKQFLSVVAPSGAGGSWISGTMSTSTAITGTYADVPLGTLLKDMGKTLVQTPANASGPHTYRKVQAVVTNGPNITATTPATGAPFYIELVTGQASQTAAASVAYLPGLM
jgi:hypothetical protein